MPRSQLTAARPVQAERAQHDGRVAGGLELLPLGHQAPPQVAEVVDLAVEDHHVPGHRVDHGLGTGGREVEDGEPAVAQQRAPAAGVRRGDPRPAGVRAAVDHGVAHPLQRGAVGLVQSSDDPGDATHRLDPPRKRDTDHIFSGPSPDRTDWFGRVALSRSRGGYPDKATELFYGPCAGVKPDESEPALGHRHNSGG